MATSSLLAELQSAVPLIGPSLLAGDFANLEREVHCLEDAGARVLHLDIMDGHFVPNLSFGIPVVEAIRRVTRLPLDVHLMISNPERYIEPFREAGADLLTIHVEAVREPRPVLERIRGLGALAGLSLNPPTPVEALEGLVDACDLILVMSVMPGFGGQAFDASALDKLRWLRSKIGPDALLSIDGGIKAETIEACAGAGAQMFVVGTGLFHNPDYRRQLDLLTSLAKSSYSVQA
jgi:ribulose-phosphate 3-epimerase